MYINYRPGRVQRKRRGLLFRQAQPLVAPRMQRCIIFTYICVRIYIYIHIYIYYTHTDIYVHYRPGWVQRTHREWLFRWARKPTAPKMRSCRRRVQWALYIYIIYIYTQIYIQIYICVCIYMCIYMCI